MTSTESTNGDEEKPHAPLVFPRTGQKVFAFSSTLPLKRFYKLEIEREMKTPCQWAKNRSYAERWRGRACGEVWFRLVGTTS